MKITNTPVRDSVYRTTIDLGKHGSLSGEYRVTPDIHFFTFENKTPLPRPVAEKLLAWPIDGEWASAAAMLNDLAHGGQSQDVIDALGTLLGVAQAQRPTV